MTMFYILLGRVLPRRGLLQVRQDEAELRAQVPLPAQGLQVQAHERQGRAGGHRAEHGGHEVLHGDGGEAVAHKLRKFAVRGPCSRDDILFGPLCVAMVFFFLLRKHRHNEGCLIYEIKVVEQMLKVH